MLAVIAHEQDAFRLVDTTGRDVGWLRSKTIGFGRFVSENAARGAAFDGARALVRCLKREYANHAVAINAAQIVYGALSWELSGTPGPSVLDAAHGPIE